jgi:molecular chaperone GrpE
MSRHSHNAPETPTETPAQGSPLEKESPAAGNGKGEDAPKTQEEAFGKKEAPDPENCTCTGSGKEGQAAEKPKPEERIADLEAKLAEANDQYLRKAAEFENFRKRMVREKQDAIDYANQSLLLDLIQTMDDFERAIKAAESAASASAEFASFVEGVSMIEKRLSSQLENKWSLKRFDSTGQPFDPNRHEAMMMEKSAAVSEPMVKEEYSKGYTLKDRVVRSAKVVVTMPENPAGSTSGDNI